MSASEQAVEIATIAAEAASNKLGEDIVALDVSDQLALTDIFLIVSARSDKQVGAIVDNIEKTLINKGHRPLRREGGKDNRWVLLDYFDVVIHVQHEEDRELYALERLWRDCPQLDLHSETATIDA